MDGSSFWQMRLDKGQAYLLSSLHTDNYQDGAFRTGAGTGYVFTKI